MKKNNFLVLLILIGILILMIIGIITYIIIKENRSLNASSFNYEIVYDDGGEPGHKYNIIVKDNKVRVIKKNNCLIKDCNEKTEENEYVYSNTNTNNLMNFIKENFGLKNSKIETNANLLTSRQKSIIRGIVLGEKYFELRVEQYKYLLVYDDGMNITYYVYFKDNNSILLKKAFINSNDTSLSDISYIDTTKLDFKNKNKKILFNYIENQRLDEDNTFTKYDVIYKNEKSIFDSIINIDEDYLNDYEKGPKLAYIFNYDGINCPTPTLRLYSDNTYELFDTNSTSGMGNKIVPKTGKYNYDINKIINSISNYESSSTGPYTIIDKDGIEYITYDTNVELMEFFKSINISLSRCTTDAPSRKLVFSLQSSMLKCPSPILKIYSDNTYEFYYSRTNDIRAEEKEPKVGTYDYDVNSILENIEKYEVDSNKTIVLTDSDGYAHYLAEYAPLEEFLKSININLHVCA